MSDAAYRFSIVVPAKRALARDQQAPEQAPEQGQQQDGLEQGTSLDAAATAVPGPADGGHPMELQAQLHHGVAASGAHDASHALEGSRGGELGVGLGPLHHMPHGLEPHRGTLKATLPLHHAPSGDREPALNSAPAGAPV